jgi:hypothetical protein
MSVQLEPLDHNIVFKPITGSSQEVAIDSRADHTLYFGTRGPGKTATQLMYFRQFVGIGYGSFWKGIIFDKHYKNFNDIISQAKRFFLQFNDCRFLGGTAEVKFVWDSGEELLLRHVKDVSDYQNFHGFEAPFLGWNELTKQSTSDLYDMMMSINRSSFTPKRDTPRLANGDFNTPDKKPLPNIPLKVFSTCNPSGPGRLWVKKRFIDVAKAGELVENKIKVFNPKTQKEEIITKTQIAIFGSYIENIYLDPSYIAELHRLTSNNPNLRKAWLEGSWDGSSGGIFDDLWDSKVHIVSRFKIPSNWFIKRCFDFGNAHPFAVVWIAEANGEEVIFENGAKITFPRGSLIVFSEYYGGEDISTNVGLGLSPKEISENIILRENTMLSQGWIQSMPQPGSADNQIGNINTSDVETIKKRMEDCGVYWTPSDKSKGSRINGLNLMRDMLKCALKNEGRGLYFMRNCVNCLESIPYLPRDEDNQEDCDTSSNDHLYDALRYGVTESLNRCITKLTINYGY